ncbi:MAG: ribosome maturation factor RimM [Gammaproteobacteria bacterium]|nr:ribosome maturation factor RimM [Gammaproteobacteria bacterium]
MTEADSKERVVLGRVTGLFGVKGWVKVYSETQPPANILDYSPWYLNLAGHWQPLELKQGQIHSKGMIARLGECTDRDQASALVGADIAVFRDQLPELKPDEFYWADLVGLKVINPTGETLGKVDHLLETGANDVLVVKDDSGKEMLVPYIKDEVIKQVDLEEGVIQIEWDLDD